MLSVFENRPDVPDILFSSDIFFARHLFMEGLFHWIIRSNGNAQSRDSK